MKVLNLNDFKSSYELHTAARRLSELFEELDPKFAVTGKIPFSVPVTDFIVSPQDLIAVSGDQPISHSYSSASCFEAVQAVLRNDKFVNAYGTWMVAEGTDYMMRMANSMRDVPRCPQYVFICLIDVKRYTQIKASK